MRSHRFFAMIVLDLSRLLSRAGRGTPTGIDRVELAYAERLLLADASAGFAAVNDLGGLSWLPRRDAQEFVETIAAAWRDGAQAAQHDRRARKLAWHVRRRLLTSGMRHLLGRLRASGERPIYLLVSHHHLEKPRIFEHVKVRGGARFVCLIHDLIPVEYPEYAKPGQAENHLRRMQTAVRFADALIVNSQVTGDALRPHLDRTGGSPPVLVAPFGTELRAVEADIAAAAAERPYFVYVSTIEARKNHLLLLNVWRRLAVELGAAAPQLLLIGQRGWEVENVIDMLDRCPSLRGTVIEHNELPDAEMVRLLKGARALLLPSFAEGFGFPVIEALALGVPALCSDIPALRETGGAVPEYLDPLDGPGWRSAILDYAAAESPRREAQLARLANWQPPVWPDHFALVDRFLTEISGPTVPEPPISAARTFCGRGDGPQQ
jgi:glycosyltransferase involved in cell wall biosynthesis